MYIRVIETRITIIYDNLTPPLMYKLDRQQGLELTSEKLHMQNKFGAKFDLNTM